MTLKGQNLRLFLDGKCVAAALSATMHASVQTEDATTKDSPNGWDEIEVTGKSLELTDEALVLLSDEMKFTLHCTQSFVKSGSTYVTDGIVRYLNAGDVLDIDCTSEYGICIFNDTKSTILAQSGYHESLRYAATSAVKVLICVYSGGSGQIEPCPVTWTSGGLTASAVYNKLKAAQKVAFSLNTTDGSNNREKTGNDIISGNAYIVDLTLNGANRQRQTYTVQLKATGEVKLPSNITGNDSASFGDEVEKEAGPIEGNIPSVQNEDEE